MNKDILENISKDLNIELSQAEATLKLLEDGNTIPFIARYRKEATKGLDEEAIKHINEVYVYEVNLLKRKEDVIRLIDEKGLLTDELKKQILEVKKLVEVEDLYRPYKEKKKTKATEAIKNGLEPLAKQIMAYTTKDINDLVKPYINENVPSIEKAIEGASYIIAEWISDNAYYRKWIRSFVYNTGMVSTKKKKDAVDENKVYEMYYDFSERVKYAKSHRIMAINRAEDEKVITVSIEVDKDKILEHLNKRVIKKNAPLNYIIEGAIKDSFKRLIFPSVEREIRSDLTIAAEDDSINNFSINLENLLMQRPMKDNVVLGFDPGYTNGCKLAVIDKTGKYLKSLIINPFTHKNHLDEIKKQLVELIKKYRVNIVAIGNGTASRESEKLIADLIKDNNLDCRYAMVSEAGASIYSTEKVAIEEFPSLSPNERSAVSIGRRLQDPLSELVKIPPEGMGVGSYQHDLPAKKLKEELSFVVTKAVNSVGVNVNTASSSLLKYVSGLTKRNIDKIINYREETGKIKTREEIKKKKILSDKAYEQAIGFLRITEGDNILDTTSIHPESYGIAKKLLEVLNLKEEQIGTPTLQEKLKNINIDEYVSILNTDKYTLEDVIEALEKPNRDPRDKIEGPILKSDILDIKDLKLGMKLEGTIRNVVPFGAFIDIGLHNDALAHISKLTKEFIKDPNEVVKVGDIVSCYVDEIDLDKNKVSLSLLDPREA